MTPSEKFAEFVAPPIESAHRSNGGRLCKPTVASDFSPVYVETFRNASRHLRPGGDFTIELDVIDLRRFPPSAPRCRLKWSPYHVGFDTLDIVNQQGVSHHYVVVGGRSGHVESRFDTHGHPNLTSWLRSLGSGCANDGSTRTGHPLRARAGNTSLFGNARRGFGAALQTGRSGHFSRGWVPCRAAERLPAGRNGASLIHVALRPSPGLL